MVANYFSLKKWMFEYAPELEQRKFLRRSIIDTFTVPCALHGSYMATRVGSTVIIECPDGGFRLTGRDEVSEMLAILSSYSIDEWIEKVVRRSREPDTRSRKWFDDCIASWIEKNLGSPEKRAQLQYLIDHHKNQVECELEDFAVLRCWDVFLVKGPHSSLQFEGSKNIARFNELVRNSSGE